MMLKGERFALCAAMLNGTIGVASTLAFQAGHNYISIAYYKLAIALMILTAYLLCKGARIYWKPFSSFKNLLTIAILSCLGVFNINVFETLAYELTNSIPLVSFVFYASGIGFMLLASAIFHPQDRLKDSIVVVLVIFGLYMLFYDAALEGNLSSLFFAVLSGISYAMFIIIVNKSSIELNTQTLWAMMLFSFVLMHFYSMVFIASMPSMLGKGIWPVMYLAIAPCIFGYVCTIKSARLTSFSNVQTIETLDPIFASCIAYALFGQTLGLSGIAGSSIVVLAVIIKIRSGRGLLLSN